MEKAVLISKNPWWKGKEYLREDEDYMKWKENKIRWLPEILDKILFEPFSLHFIFGPRQVGKTTLIKLAIEELLDKHKPEEIFYFKCDELKDYKELKEVIDAYFEIRESFKVERSYIFLDEITFADEWFRIIKSYIDDGKFKKDVLVISGSASLEIMKHIEYFPGRRGNGKDFFIYPLCFREFVKIIKPEIFKKLPGFSSFDEQEMKGKISKAFFYYEELNKLMNLYMKIGGFPLSINSYFLRGVIDSSIKEIYLNWVKSDLAKVNRNSNVAREILKSVINKIPSPMSWENIAKESSIKSPKTVNVYLHIFEELFLINIGYFLDLNNLSIEFGKNKKIHLADPLYYELFEEWCLIEIKDKENKKAESILASHLARLGRGSKLFSEKIYYWRNGNEIDVVVRMKNKAIGFEAKWGKEAKPREKIIGKMKETFLISKEKFDFNRRIIPLSIFLSLLDV